MSPVSSGHYMGKQKTSLQLGFQTFCACTAFRHENLLYVIITFSHTLHLQILTGSYMHFALYVAPLSIFHFYIKQNLSPALTCLRNLVRINVC